MIRQNVCSNSIGIDLQANCTHNLVTSSLYYIEVSLYIFSKTLNVNPGVRGMAMSSLFQDISWLKVQHASADLNKLCSKWTGAQNAF